MLCCVVVKNIFKFMDDCHKLISRLMTTWYYLPMAAKCRFVQGSLPEASIQLFWPIVSKRSRLQLLNWVVLQSLAQGFVPPNLIKWLPDQFQTKLSYQSTRILASRPDIGESSLQTRIAEFWGASLEYLPLKIRGKYSKPLGLLLACTSL